MSPFSPVYEKYLIIFLVLVYLCILVIFFRTFMNEELSSIDLLLLFAVERRTFLKVALLVFQLLPFLFFPSFFLLYAFKSALDVYHKIYIHDRKAGGIFLPPWHLLSTFFTANVKEMPSPAKGCLGCRPWEQVDCVLTDTVTRTSRQGGPLWSQRDSSVTLQLKARLPSASVLQGNRSRSLWYIVSDRGRVVAWLIPCCV